MSLLTLHIFFSQDLLLTFTGLKYVAKQYGEHFDLDYIENEMN